MEVSAYLLLTGLGLATAAGLNAYIPLLVAGGLAHFGVIHLSSPYDLLAGWPALTILAVLLVIEIVADKVPAVDSVNDVIQTVIRPASGAVLFAGALDSYGEWGQAVGLIAGLLTAGSVHAAKSSIRPVANVSTAGVAAPVLSTVEDFFSVALSFVAILLPLLVLVLLALLIWGLYRAYRRMRRASVARSASQLTSASPPGG